MTPFEKTLYYDVPIINLYNFLLDFTEVIPAANSNRSSDSTEDEYTIETYFGDLRFIILEKNPPNRIVLDYDLSKSSMKSKGRLSLNLTELSPGRVKLEVKDEMIEPTDIKESVNWLGKNLKTWLRVTAGTETRTSTAKGWWSRQE